MPQSIALAEKYLPLLDQVYKKESKTAILAGANSNVRFLGANKVEIYKLSMQGLGDYSRSSGFASGDITGAWESHTLAQDRGRTFTIDSMDDEETLGLTVANTLGEFERTQVIPELDAYRFAKMAGTNGISSANADITIGTTDIPTLIDTAERTMGDNEVPEEGRILFVSETCYSALKAKITRKVSNGEMGIETAVETYDGMPVVKVPTGRFQTAITLYDGTTQGEKDGGFIPTATTGYKINFMIVHPSAVIPVVKHVVPRIFSPAENQLADAWKVDYRCYHDLFVMANKVNGIYLHRASTAIS